MKTHMKQGWRLTFKHFYLLLLVFVYQLLWGFFLYRAIDETVSPLLRRFPGATASAQAVQTFLTEAQIELFKTDMAMPYLWMLGGLFAARMLLTPLFNAGFFHSMLQQSRSGGGTRFREGVRKAWKPVMLLYWLQALLTFAPAYFLLPKAYNALLTSHSTNELIMTLLPGAALWLLWGIVVSLLSLSLQVGAVSEESMAAVLWRSIRHFLPYAALSMLMWMIGMTLGLAVTGVSLVWAGFIALVVHQSYHLIKIMMKMWTLATQLLYLESRREP
ncbi:hypothetical protein [Paenibacillus sp. HB172176]|uniref:hypothetical protein n=1 Tax=Paenibacillus sp. HB172176 TaxID=2493690 RepID=UPI0014393ABB|nr:hypothetical protein [Paenibacillus sp. HB172176]